jgi:hypothetical protein
MTTYSQVQTLDPSPPEPPEHQNDRRRFLVWALMVGAVKPERLTERIVAEVDELDSPCLSQ